MYVYQKGERGDVPIGAFTHLLNYVEIIEGKSLYMHRRLLEDHTIHNQLRCGTEETDDDGCVVDPTHSRKVLAPLLRTPASRKKQRKSKRKRTEKRALRLVCWGAE